MLATDAATMVPLAPYGTWSEGMPFNAKVNELLEGTATVVTVRLTDMVVERGVATNGYEPD